jgi:CPA2 family monovalent cation:H+ antiporter-2
MIGFTMLFASGESTSAPLAISLLALTATAALVATIFRRLKLEAIPGFLLAGVLVGPVLGIVRDADSIEQITHLATILLMFGIGLQLEVDAIRRGMLPILAIGAVSTVAFVVGGTPIGLAFDNTLPQSIAINLAFAMSSTALLLRVLQERREVKATVGRLCIGISIVQDLFSVIALALLPGIARWAAAAATDAQPTPSGPSPLLDLAKSAAIGVGGITVLILAGRYLLPRAMHMVARTGSTELVLVFSAAVALAAAIGASAVGFSPEMGAFLAGFMLATTPYKQQLTGQFAPMRDLLMPIFFTVVGLKVDLPSLASGWGQVVMGTIALLTVKSMLISIAAWALGASASLAILAGLYLSQAGEFSLVILSQAATQDIITPQSQARLIAIVILTLIISPMLVEPAHKLAHLAQHIRPAPWIRRSPLRESRDRTRAQTEDGVEIVTHAEPPLALIAGFGPVGRDIAEKLRSKGWRIAIIELNPSTVHRQTELGRSILYGDVTNPEVLEAAGISEAAAFILTIPDHESAVAATRLARAANTSVYIAVRAAYLSYAIQAREAGADDVTIEEVATATIMSRDVVHAIGKRGLGSPSLTTTN